MSIELTHNTMSAKETLKDMSHTPPTGESVDEVWKRGEEKEN
jgi:hypothetical protein